VEGSRVGAADTRILTGNLHGSSTEGKLFKGRIIDAIRYNYECSDSNAIIPVSGIVTIVLDADVVTLDYGDGACDRTYTVTINNNVKTYSF
jgi:hypothetical protein